MASDRWLIGHRNVGGWVTDAWFDESILARHDYDLSVRLANDTVTLSVDGLMKLSHTFGDSVTGGEIGIGTRDALSYFDNIRVEEYEPPPLPPSTVLPVWEDFEAGQAEFFEQRAGDWVVQDGRYYTTPAAGQDGVSTLRIAEPLPLQFEIYSTINANDVSSGRLSNAMIIFDYQGPSDFKFAGAYVGANRWLVGQRNAGGWQELATVNASINAWNDYDLRVLVTDETARLFVNGQAVLSHTYADSLSDGDVGVGTRNALAQFDDVQVRLYEPPPSAPLPWSEDFDDGSADFVDVQSGSWSVESGSFRVVPALDQDGISTFRVTEPLPAELMISASMHADDLSPNRFSNGFVIFDYQGPTNFKFAGAYVASDLWLIGRRTTNGWTTDVSLSETISPWTSYSISVVLDAGHVQLFVDGTEKLAQQYADSVTDGALGIGTRNALATFDDVEVQVATTQALSVAGMGQALPTGGQSNGLTDAPSQRLRREHEFQLRGQSALSPTVTFPPEPLQRNSAVPWVPHLLDSSIDTVEELFREFDEYELLEEWLAPK